ncbi:dihydroxy-acid dehydratase [Rhodococcus rhodnii]|uniref:Dihydroxy-acid dehydratase n=2 Tax=Rhodococcus rhodnii TaxID=38312 RepID=R7WI33_9NOCA|nr:dihydroxy-acid dehydratase [Rhodococcus rhodnii]EOM74815.1 dihydroxy-acid dehydratase [Rhodococcus rhodnii LMG 5362]TXG90970.1 dihydroxy-acid dehydratase [Rhodococcus rhodnii]
MTGTESTDGPQGLTGNLTHYGDPGFAAYLRRSFTKSMGYGEDALSRPTIGIATSESGFNNCHRQMPELVAAIERGVMLAGGLPVAFPTISLGEPFLHPTSMKFRNLMAMDVEEMVRAQPVDSVVLVGGCDKTVPAQLMGAFSVDKPAVQVVTGPMMTGSYHGERLGACTDCRRFWGRYRAGEITEPQITAVEGNLATTSGTCAVMGTASTMACIAEALGMSLPGTAAIPNVHADRLRAGEASGALATQLARVAVRPSEIVTKDSVVNALRVLLAIGGSTNAVIHLTAMARRLGLGFTAEELNGLSDTTPVLVDLKPSGEHYMEDFHRAGGVPAVFRELGDLMNLDCATVAGTTWRDVLADTDPWRDERVVRPVATPVSVVGGIVSLSGNLAPGGAILKRSAADESLFESEGRAVVFDSLQDLADRIDSPDLDVRADDVLVLRNAGPVAEAMPEAGYIPIPKVLAEQGVKDMVRISDARMSGTAYGTIVLHIAPEAAVGGPLALVRDGDRIRMSVRQRSLELLVSDEELDRRREEWQPPACGDERGYSRLYRDHVLQADEGCDFDFCLPTTTKG